MWVGLRGLRGWWHEGDFDWSIVPHTFLGPPQLFTFRGVPRKICENLSFEELEESTITNDAFLHFENTLHLKEATSLLRRRWYRIYRGLRSLRSRRANKHAFNPLSECLPGPCLSLNYRQGLFHVGIPRATYLIALFRARTHTTGPYVKKKAVGEWRKKMASIIRGQG